MEHSSSPSFSNHEEEREDGTINHQRHFLASKRTKRESSDLEIRVPCQTLRTEKFGTFVFKHAQATKSNFVGIKFTNSICCKKPRLEGQPGENIVLGDITQYVPVWIATILCLFSCVFIPAQLRRKLAPCSSTNKEQHASLSSSSKSNGQLTVDSLSSSIAAGAIPSLHLMVISQIDFQKDKELNEEKMKEKLASFLFLLWYSSVLQAVFTLEQSQNLDCY